MTAQRTTFRRRVIARLAVAVLVAAVAAVPQSHAGAQPLPDAVVDPALREALRNGGTADFWVHLSAIADLSGAYGIADWAQRGRFVVDRLRETATSSQQDLVGELRTRAVKHQTFWVANRVLVRQGTAAVLDAVVARAGVAKVTVGHVFSVVQPRQTGRAAQVDEVDWNVADTGADAVWREFGVRGDGVVVASIDTGVQFDHPALAAQYRGRRADGTVDHTRNWYDPDAVCVPTGDRPCDDQGHGTHTMGTVVGDGGEGNRIGVAPGARWIAAKGCQVTTCPEHALLAAGQWMLAPTDAAGRDPDPAARPHVIMNAWEDQDGSNTWYRDVVRAWHAAGQFAAFAAGNNGQHRCASVSAPASYPESYAVGAHDRDNVLTFFSGLGPSPVDGGIKPNVTAPGVDVRSAALGGGYRVEGGTSMAVAHAVGAVALLLSAAPTLVGDVPATRAALDGSARDPFYPDFIGCGSTAGADTLHGAGLLDAFAAVRRVASADVATLAGRVTDADTGAPLAEARVRAAGDEATTATDGTYHLFLPAGTHDVETAAFGHATRIADVTLTAGQTTRHDTALDPVALVTVSGTVTDASGQGWPLRARVQVDGLPGGPVTTDAVTGTYAVRLAPGARHTVTVTATGYLPATREVDVPGTDSTQDFALTADPTCTAPGYRLDQGLHQGFDSGAKPEGWTVRIGQPDPFDPQAGGWRFDDPVRRGNLTGGTGGAAIADSDHAGPFTQIDTDLTSPPVDLSGVAAPVVRFRHDLPTNDDEIADVDVSTDGGGSWTTVWRQEGQFGLGDRRGPRVEEVAIPEAAGQSDVRVRFHYHNANFDWWWQVDDVVVGGAPCASDPGGLVVGTVTDAPTGTPRSATVDSATTDRDGRYTLFTSTGPHTLTASSPGFESETRTVDVPAGGVTRADFVLGAGHLVVTPTRIDSTLPVGGSARVPLTLTNDGTKDVDFRLAQRDHGFRSATAPATQPPAVQRIPADVNDQWAGAQPDAAPAGDTAATAPPWEQVASYPARVFDAAAAEHDGKVYVAGGVHAADGDDFFSNDLYVYDPDLNRWDAKADFSQTREAPAAAFLDGRLHLVGGWLDTGATTTRLEVYDPATDTWTRRADAPAGRSAPGVAVLDGKLYMVGGCTSASCPRSADTFRYDPATDTWATVADYPHAVSFLSCGTVDGTLVCAGGSGGDEPRAETYAYDPAADQWRPLAPMPIPAWGAAHAVANGALVVAGGVSAFSGFEYVTSEASAYDVARDEWTVLPAAGHATYRTAGACGFYKVGGATAEFPSPRTRMVERLPGWDRCGDPSARWLSLGTTEGTVPAGQSVTVEVSVAAGDQPGTYAAGIVVVEDTPYVVRPVPVLVDATPPPSWGLVEGVVTGLGHCDTPGTPLPGAAVDISGTPLKAGVDGRFALWRDSAAGPVTVSATRDGYLAGRVEGVAVTAGGTTTANVDLRRDQACASIAPQRLDLTVRAGATASADLALANTGTTSYEIAVAETPVALDPAATRPFTVPPGASKLTLPTAPPDPVPPVPSWFDAAALPGGLMAYGHAQCDGDPDHAYLLSGVNAGGVSADGTWRYDATANRWSELAPLPQDLWPETPTRFGLTLPTAVCEAGQIHLLGGTHEFVPSTAHFVYDIASDTWFRAADAPRALSGAASGAWNGKVYLVGGQTAFGVSGQVDVYDIATDTWTTLPEPMPEPAYQAGYARAGRHLYVVGGGGVPDSAAPTTTRRLDLATGEWTVGPPLADRLLLPALAVTDTALYLIGGLVIFGGASDHVDRLPTASWPGGAWTAFDPLPEEKINVGGFCTRATTGGEIMTAAGFDTRFSSERTLVHGVVPERCPTIRADVPWLSVSRTEADVAGGGSTTLSVRVDATGLAPGEHTATLLVTTTAPGAAELRVPVRVTVQDSAPPSLYFSLETGGTVRGVEVADEDVVGVNPDGVVTPYFDGGDVGLSGLRLDAFARLPGGALALSFTEPASIPGVAGTVDDSDLVRFTPTSLGATTAGTFELWFDGSDVALAADDEDVDAVDVLADGRIALSTTGALKAGPVAADDEDLVAFTPTSLGQNTAGAFALLFDGGDVGLAAADEDVDALAVRSDGALALSTTGPLSVVGLSASDDDVVAFTPTTLGRDTVGAYALLVDGAALGLEPDDITGVALP
ncbi:MULTISPECIES: Kelch repeat-containing protein [unclassified Saccharothrix]|uniref:Kelch repeat-containing protein n=1 Tax=unclassified Saccharothrix TaxID=2593673 RepID=UPI00307F781A